MAAAPPTLPDDLVQEILLRFPTDDPTCLLRPSLVCKAWSGVISRHGFRRRLHELHRAPPLLGFLHAETSVGTPCFIPTTASSFSLAAPDHYSWLALDCRHGRALFLSRSQDDEEFLVWEPIMGTQERVPVPVPFEFGYSAATVFCIVYGCDHRDCLGGPFCVLFVFSSKEDADESITSACIYSSETGAWGGLTTMHNEFIGFTEYSTVLVGSSLLYFIVYDYKDSEMILEYDLSRHFLTMFSVPDHHCDCIYTLMVTEDGGLGVIQDLHQHVKLWTREVSDGADAQWLLSWVIYLHNLLPASARGYGVRVMGFAEGANAIFLARLSACLQLICNPSMQGRCLIIAASVSINWFQLSPSTLLRPEATTRISWCRSLVRRQVVRRWERGRKQYIRHNSYSTRGPMLSMMGNMSTPSSASATTIMAGFHIMGKLLWNVLPR